MTTADTNVQNLIINTMTKAMYDTITPSDTELYMITDEVITGNDVINGLGYTPVNTDLSNLSANGKAVIDGQWVWNYNQARTDVSISSSTDDGVSLTSYLPNDGAKYEVMITGNIVAATNKELWLNVKSDLTNNYLSLARSTGYGAGSTIIPVGTGRTITIQRYSGWGGTYTLTLLGYRRLGSNL